MDKYFAADFEGTFYICKRIERLCILLYNSNPEFKTENYKEFEMNHPSWYPISIEKFIELKLKYGF